MEIDGPVTYVHQRGNVVGRFSFRDPSQCFDLSLGQRKIDGFLPRLLRKTPPNDFYQQLEIKRFGNEIVAPRSARLQMAFTASIRGDEQEWNVVQPAHAFAESGKDIESGHLRHVYVAQDKIRKNSDETLAALLILAGRSEILAAARIIDMRNKLAETVAEVDQILKKADQSSQP